MSYPLRKLVVLLSAFCFLLSAATGLFVYRARLDSGFRLVVYQGNRFAGTPILSQNTPAPDFDFLANHPDLSRSFSAQWLGEWNIHRSGVYEFSIGVDDAANFWIDGRKIKTVTPKDFQPVFFLVPMSAGLHEIRIDFRQLGGAFHLNILAAPAEKDLQPLAQYDIFPTIPDTSRLHTNQIATALFRISLLFWILPLALCIAFALPYCDSLFHRVYSRISESRIGKANSALMIALPILIVLYGGALRYEAVLGRFGPIRGSDRFVSTATTIQHWISHLRPQSLGWQPETVWSYEKGDPAGYIRFAREMTEFYAAHVREPVYVLTTKVFLGLLNQQDIAVSFASAFFSTLAILATYLLGSFAFSRMVGLSAALCLAIERTVIVWGSTGYRDDAFMFILLLFAYACLRLAKTPSFANVLFLGAIGGVACLIRITSLSFILPCYAHLIITSKVTPLRARLVPIACSLLLSIVIFAPFMINCAIVYGDPLYPVNDQTKTFRSREGYDSTQSMGWSDYLKTRLLDRPYRLIYTGTFGSTIYPISNKWTGFDPWNPALGSALFYFSLAGLLLFAASFEGRFLLLLLVFALQPFAFTWNVPGGAAYRYTLFAYPIFLIASWYALTRAALLLNPSHREKLLSYFKTNKRKCAIAAVVIVAGMSVAFVSYRCLQTLRWKESLQAGEVLGIDVGQRDNLFFGKGWSRALSIRNYDFRVTQEPQCFLNIPLIKDAYSLHLFIDPLLYEPEMQRRVRLNLNGAPLTELFLQSPGTKMFNVTLPSEKVRDGMNRISLDLSEPVGGQFSALAISRLAAERVNPKDAP